MSSNEHLRFSRRWRILAVHCYYQQRGGEDSVFEAETAAMESAGWMVERLVAHNDALKDFDRGQIARMTIWNQTWATRIRQAISTFRPEVVHFHNTFPLISSAGFWAVRAAGIPCVQTLHNFRLGCLNAAFYRDGTNCFDCLGKIPLAGVVHGCYRGRAPSAVLASAIACHRALRTHHKAVDRFLVLSESSKDLYLKMGLQKEKVVVKPNSLFPDPQVGIGSGGYAIFVGRLTVDKGVRTLLKAWMNNPSLPLLKIAGDGDLAEEVLRASANTSNIEYLGRVSKPQVAALFSEARFSVVPSEWLELCPMTVVESLAAGTPVLSSDSPSLIEMIGPSFEPFVYRQGNVDELGSQAAAINSQCQSLRQRARMRFEQTFSLNASLAKLDEVYANIQR